MLSDTKFQAWCNRLQLSQQQINLVNQIRTSPPTLKVRGSGRNVHGPYASKKNGQNNSIRIPHRRITCYCSVL